MLCPSVRVFLLTAFAALSTCNAHAAIAADSIGGPSVTDIHKLEELVRLPDGAVSIGDYVRYYYLSPAGEPQAIMGIYVDKNDLELEPSQVPSDGVVLVSRDEDVSRPWDAGCGVVHVRYLLANPAKVRAWCDPALDVSSPDGAGMFILFALTVPIGVILAAVVWFSRRWVARKAQGPRDHAA